MNSRYIKAVRHLRMGGVIAYPTEAVYGLGCDPFDPVAVSRLLTIKQRLLHKGLIVVAASTEQFSPWLGDLPAELAHRCNESWPGPTTWVVPLDLMGRHFPYWITGDFESVALRVSNHPTVQALCTAFGSPIVSTSANMAGRTALTSAIRVRQQFGERVDEIVGGAIGGDAKPSTIKDLLTGKVLR